MLEVSAAASPVLASAPSGGGSLGNEVFSPDPDPVSMGRFKQTERRRRGSGVVYRHSCEGPSVCVFTTHEHSRDTP